MEGDPTRVKLLKRGESGSLVREWPTFLRGQGFAVTVSGVLDSATEKGTREFQAKHKLAVDGKVGNETFGKAMSLGFEMVEQLSTSMPRGIVGEPAGRIVRRR